MQRLFSTFPNGRPGAGLLLLRLAVGCSLAIETVPAMWGIPQSLELEVRLGLVGVGILLLVGLWTPVAGTASGIIELLITFSNAGNYVPHLLLAILGISLALLGPGAWSIDARVFGRKRIEIKSGNTRSDGPSETGA